MDKCPGVEEIDCFIGGGASADTVGGGRGKDGLHSGDERKVGQENVVHFDNQALQLPKVKGVSTLAGRKVEVRRRLDGSLDTLAGEGIVVSLLQPDKARTKQHHLVA